MAVKWPKGARLKAKAAKAWTVAGKRAKAKRMKSPAEAMRIAARKLAKP